MFGTIDISFKPGGETVPNILQMIESRGHTLRALRLIPCFGGGQATLKVDIGTCRSTPEMVDLASRLLALEETIEVIHSATCRSSSDSGCLLPT